MESALKQKIKNNKFIVGVFGLGRLGLPIAIKFASKRINVVGLDINETLIKTISSGNMPFKEENTKGLLRETLNDKLLEVTSNVKKLKAADVIILCIEISLDETIRPDCSPLL